MTTQTAPTSDPRRRYASPPFKSQPSLDPTGKDADMAPEADHGEQSYVGHGTLTDYAAVITGGDSGIGRAIAIAYAREGADVVIGYYDDQERDDAEQTASYVTAAGRKAVIIQADLQKQDNCKRAIEQAVDQLGRIDVLINNAAYQQTRDSIDGFDTQMFDQIMKTNVYAPFWLSQLAAPHMHPGASIIHTVSIQAYDPSAILMPYAASKSALTSMTKSMAKLLIQRGIRVNAVAPGPVWTPLIPSTMPEDKVKNFGSDTAFGRPAMPAEIAPLYVWLASPQASYVTGEVFGATGGQSPV